MPQSKEKPYLGNETFKLVPSTDYDYAISLAHDIKKYEVDPKDLAQYVTFLWEGYYNGVRVGVISCSRIDSIYMLDGYSEKAQIKKLKPPFSLAEKAVDLVSTFMKKHADELYASTSVNERGVNRLLKRKNFRLFNTVHTDLGDFNIYVKEI